MPSTGRTVSILLNASGAPQALRVPVYLLRVLNGADARKQKRVSQARLRIGSGPGADFQLNDPTVSALHCEIVADDRGYRVRDLGAKNGVVVGGRRVEVAWLEPQDEIVLGETSLRFKLLDEDDEQPLDPRSAFGRLRGGSVRMRELYAFLAKAADSETTVLLTGETGTGKELAAEAIVLEGRRRAKPFVVVDCAALPPTLAESELFGHEKYAFTGATSQHIGAFERAQGGTVFLDEIGELPRDLQPKLLGVLERRAVQRLGGSGLIPLDVRVISATHRNLEREVNSGAFRADLFYRLAVTEIRLPALRDRKGDIPDLVGHFLEGLPKAQPLAPIVLQRLNDADYPGNVRELRNAVERVALGLDFASAKGGGSAVEVALEVPYRTQREGLLADFDRAYFKKLLEACQGNVSEASRRSGINRVHLYKMLSRAGLER